MSREIKFRAKRLNNNEFVIGYYLPMVYGHKHFIYLPLEYLNEHSRIEIDPKTLGQYTGLKDKDGKEIYEGDVVRIWADPKDYNGYKGHNYIGVVEWDEFILGFILSDGHGLKDFEFIEIVGNIYENPELLNKEDE